MSVQTLPTEHGVFTNNIHSGQTAEEVYQEWLENKDKPAPLSEIEQLRLEQSQANAELFEMMLMLTGGGL